MNIDAIETPGRAHRIADQIGPSWSKYPI